MIQEKVGLTSLEDLSPAGYYVAVRIRFAFPLYEENRFPPDWVDHYTAAGFMLFDPVVQWIYRNTGTTSWSALAANDPQDVLDAAAACGMVYGTVVSVSDTETGERSYGSFGRSDRDHTAEEIEHLMHYVQTLHDTKKRPSGLTDAETEALRFVRDGMRFKQIAHLLGISESAVKARLTNAKRKLEARTSVHAVSIATEHGLL